MAINFPTSLDDNTSIITVTDNVDDVLAIHQNLKRDAIVAVETKLGYGADTPTVGEFLVGNTTAGTSQWRTIASSDVPNLTGKTYNALTLTAAAVGFTIAGGTTSKTLTVPLDASVSGTNTGDQDLSGLITKATLDAYSVLVANTDDTPVAVALSANSVLGRIAGNIVAVTIDSDLSSTSASDDTIPSAKATKAYADLMVPKTLFDANTIIYATTDNTPVSLTIGASTIVGRKATGDIVALTATESRTILNVADGATANTKATGAEVDTGTDDTKFATAKALKDSHNVPSVAPGTSGNVLVSNGTDWTSSAPAASVSVTTKGDLQTYSTVAARLPVGDDGNILEARSSETTGLKWIKPPATDTITLVIPSLDLTANGEKIIRNANENQAFGDVCFYNSDGQCQIADADAIATAKVKLMAIATISANSDGYYLKTGVARNDTWNWTVGGDIYLTVTGTSGNTLSQTPPSGTDDCQVYLGYALSADVIMFEPDKNIIERT